jgi:hypothetical protein
VITVHDLKTPDQPAVVRALKVACGMCHVPAGEFCRPARLGGKLVTLVHIARATAHYKEAKGER